MKRTAQFFDEIRMAYKKSMPFVVYKSPRTDEMRSIICANRELQYLDDFQEQGFVMAPFDSDKMPLVFDLERSEFNFCGIEKDWNPEMESQTIKSFKSPDNHEKKSHVALVNRAISKIKEGFAEKIVLSRKERLDVSQNDPIVLFYRLISKIPHAFTYVWFHPEMGMWAGASPEKLVSVQKAGFHTMALAGTQKYVKGEEVIWSEKEKKEQQIVTDQICVLLDSLSLSIGEPYTKRAKNLLRICTDIKGQLPEDVNIAFLVKKLHPTSAVCGMPVGVTKRFIKNHEGYDRKFYAGYLGELNMPGLKSNNGESNSLHDQQSQLYVNLRCMEIKTRGELPEVNLFVGGGITAASDPISEWEETVEKSMVMKSILY
jgi:isochorismate synthase